ncbi:MAG: hypothetical protein ABUL64_00220 [Singulisphaera sp.]
MDLLARAYRQCLELVQGMSYRARIAAALSALVVLTCFAYLGSRELAADTVYLLGGQELSASELTAMQGALGKAKLNDFVLDGNRLRVPRAQQAVYLGALADADALPQTLTDIFSAATDKATWFTSRQQQLDQARIAKKKGLALMLRGMQGVENVDVDFDKEEPRGLRRDRIATAFVALKLRAGQTLDEERAAFFQRTVAAALNMAPHEVTVADKANLVVFGGRGTAAAGDDQYRDLKRKYQADYEENIRKALAYVPGITVSADVELDREVRREERRVDFDANQPANLAPRSRAVLAKESSHADETLGTQHQTTVEIAGLTPKRVAISVGVPSSYFENVFRQRRAGANATDSDKPPAAELAQLQSEEIARIRQHVAGLIPTIGAGEKPAITVTPFSTLAEPELPQPTITTLVVSWLLESWTTLAAILAALVGLFALRALLRDVVQGGAKQRESQASQTIAHRPGAPAPSERFRTEFEHQRTPGRSMRDEVAELVRQDPAAAANILRTWIGNVNS